MRPLPDLVGSVVLRPGSAHAPVTSTRPDLAPRLLAGAAPGELLPRLGALFAACAGAHRFAARAALRAAGAMPHGDVDDATARDALRVAVAREHVLRFGHDGPRLFGLAPQAGLVADCPLWSPASTPARQLEAAAGWLAANWLGEPPTAALQRWSGGGAPSLAAWVARHDGLPARVLRAAAWQLPTAALAAAEGVLDPREPATADALGAAMARPGFCLRPDGLFAGTVPDTGPWNRLGAGPVGALGASARFVARWLELLWLLAPGGEPVLAHGTRRLADGAVLSWVEACRGLLCHRLQLDGEGPGARIADYRVLPPTAWNVHPAGVLGRAVAALPAGAGHTAALVAAAFDPCMPVRVAAAQDMLEVAHA